MSKPTTKPVKQKKELDVVKAINALDGLCSADLELVINAAARRLRSTALKEAQQLLLMVTNPKTKRLLKQLENS